MDQKKNTKSNNGENIWLDTDSDHSVGLNHPVGEIGYGLVGLEDTARLEQDEEEDKNDLLRAFSDIIKNEDESSVEEFLKQNKDQIEATDRSMYIYMLVVLEGEKHYATVNDFFDNNFPNVAQTDELLMTEEPPENIEELKNNIVELEKMRTAAFQVALNGRHKHAVQSFINSDGENIKIDPRQLYQLYELGLSYLYRALNEQVKINRPKQSATNVIIEGFKQHNKLSDHFGINDSTIQEDNQDARLNVTYVDILDILLEKGVNNSECRRITSKITDKVILSEIVGLLIMKGRQSLMTEVIKENNVEYDSTFVKLSIEYDWLDITFRLRDTYPQSFAADEDSFLEVIILSFTKSNYCWLAKWFLLKSIVGIISYRKAESLLLGILSKVDKADPIDNPLYFTPNVLLMILNLYEICVLLENEFPFLNAIIAKILEHITLVASNFIENVKDEERLRSIVFEKDFENRDSLELISHYDITEIMDNKNMEKIALELWSSDYDVKGGIMEWSSAMTIVGYNSFNKPRDIVDDYMFYNWSNRMPNKYAHHLLQFEVWKKSMKAKFITEGVFLFLITVVFQFYLEEALNSGHELLNAYNAARAAGGTQAEIDAALEEHAGAAATFREDMAITEYLSMIAFFYPVRMILEMLFATKTNRGLKFVNLTNLLDWTVAIVFAIRLGREYDKYRDGLSSLDTQVQKDIRYFENIYQFEDDEVLLDVLYSIGWGWLWLRLMIMLRLTKFLGPLLKMIYNMLWDISIFMVLFAIILVIYSSIGNLLFYTESGYGNFQDTMVTLFGSALGNFDLNALDSSNKGEVVGKIFIISFVILWNILILNLLIAILSSTYALLEEKKLVLYINEILKLRSSLDYDKKATGLVSAFPPWNIFPLIFSPFYFVKGDTTKLNNIVFHICYIPVMTLIIIVFLIFNILLLPLAYIKGCIVKFQIIFNKKVEAPLKRRIITFIVFLLLGIGIVILNLWMDMVAFVMHLYQPTIRYRKEQSKVKYISNANYNRLQRKFEIDAKKGIQVVEFVDFSVYVRSFMNIIDLFQKLIFGSDDNVSLDNRVFMLQEYGKIKDTLQNGSITFGSHQYIYPGIMKYILRELKVNARIRKILTNKKTVKVEENTTMKVDKSYEDDKDKEHLSSFLHICMGEVHEAILSTQSNEVTLDGIKEIFETVLYEKTDEGKAIKAKEEFKSPFKRTTSVMSQRSNVWNVKDTAEAQNRVRSKANSNNNIDMSMSQSQWDGNS